MKILGSDYDGTLTYGGMNETKLSAIEKWRKAGHKFGIVSGRGKDFRKDLLQQIPQLKLDFLPRAMAGILRMKMTLLSLKLGVTRWRCRSL